MPKYKIIGEPDEKGFAKYRRARDGKCAIAKTSWFKKLPDGDELVPKSRTKALKLGMLDWE